MHFRISENGVWSKRKEKKSFWHKLICYIESMFYSIIIKIKDIVTHIMKSIYCIFLAICNKPIEEYNRNFPIFDLGIPFRTTDVCTCFCLPRVSISTLSIYTKRINIYHIIPYFRNGIWIKDIEIDRIEVSSTCVSF